MPLLLPCRTCGELFTPTLADLRRGPPHWWRCPRCRPDNDAGETHERKELTP
jgi:hypothetical protein